ncbi:MAG TPA: hypothetical protein VHI13_16770 [Candidatus Kapabacteria bacterium]|nr:hypothetical protein [Candidatus Kapabacteria bacterium]
MSFSVIERSLAELEVRAIRERSLQAAEPWDLSERTPERQAERVAAATESFCEFERIYFPPQVHLDGYWPPNALHRDIVDSCHTPGVHLFLGPRDHGKTVKMKMVLAWLTLTAQVQTAATLSQVIPTSSNILDDIAEMVFYNPRIAHDFGVECIENNEKQIRFRTYMNGRFQPVATIGAFSEGVSLRGFTKGFGRPRFILCDDFETSVSPLGDDQVKARIRFISEARRSLSRTGVLYWSANNFDVRCASNVLKQQAEKGTLSAGWYVHCWPIWSPEYGVLWPERFPGCTTLEDVQAATNALDDADFWGNDMQEPRQPDGEFFTRDHYHLWRSLPDDARGVVVTDPNLSLKGAGDTTAVVGLLFAPSTMAFYILPGVVCRSMRAPEHVLESALGMRNDRIVMLAMDGSVSQEAHWTNHIVAWCRINQRAYPPLHFYRYTVDNISIGAALVYNGDRLYFPPDMALHEDGKRAEAMVRLPRKEAIPQG